MKPRKGILKAIFRGVVKSFPIGNVIVETIQNYKAKPLLNVEPSEQAEIVNKTEKPHNWVSIAVQLLITAGIVYAFATKQITIDKLIELLNGL